MGSIIAGEKKYTAQQKARFAVLLALAVWAVVIAAGVTLAVVLGGGGEDGGEPAGGNAAQASGR